MDIVKFVNGCRQIVFDELGRQTRGSSVLSRDKASSIFDCAGCSSFSKNQ